MDDVSRECYNCNKPEDCDDQKEAFPASAMEWEDRIGPMV